MSTELTCPSCNATMTRENFASAFVNVCSDGCRGLWFDGGDLAKLDQAKKGIGPALQRALAQPYTEPEHPREQLGCPNCKSPLEQNEYDLAAWVAVDECPSCDGVFLDAGELARIRARPLTTAEQARAGRGRRARRSITKRVRDEADARTRRAHVNFMIYGLM